MTPLEKVLFVADKIEPAKVAAHVAYREVYDLSLTSLDAAVLRYLDLNLEEAVRRRWLTHRRSHEARNELLLSTR
jgi:HD superfamily phosphohydrolase YqeK